MKPEGPLNFTSCIDLNVNFFMKVSFSGLTKKDLFT